MNYIIRPGKETDVPRLTEIYNMSIEKGKITADMDKLSLENRLIWFSGFTDRHPIFVIEVDSKVLGYCYLSPYRPGRRALDSVVEISYYLDLDYTSMGLGSLLMENTLSVAKILGYKTVVAILLSSNTPSIGILEKFGFSKWGEIPQAANYGDDWYSHLYYGKKL